MYSLVVILVGFATHHGDPFIRLVVPYLGFDYLYRVRYRVPQVCLGLAMLSLR